MDRRTLSHKANDADAGAVHIMAATARDRNAAPWQNRASSLVEIESRDVQHNRLSTGRHIRCLATIR